MPNAVVTGGSAGLGRALSLQLCARGYCVTIDARGTETLNAAAAEIRARTGAEVDTVAGDVTHARHRAELVRRAASHGPIDVLVNNASELGGSPPPRLVDLRSEVSQRLWRVNVDAPLQLVRQARPRLAEHAVIMNISSDAAVSHYEGWGGYAATKAALDHQTLTWAAEEPRHTWYAVDPGDLRTAMHQAAFPGEDIGDRPLPESVSGVLVDLIGSGLGSGRYRAADLAGLLRGWPPRPRLSGARPAPAGREEGVPAWPTRA